MFAPNDRLDAEYNDFEEEPAIGDVAQCWWCQYVSPDSTPDNPGADELLRRTYEKYVQIVGVRDLSVMLHALWRAEVQAPAEATGEQIPAMTPELFEVHIREHMRDPRLWFNDTMDMQRAILETTYATMFRTNDADGQPHKEIDKHVYAIFRSTRRDMQEMWINRARIVGNDPGSVALPSKRVRFAERPLAPDAQAAEIDEQRVGQE